MLDIYFEPDYGKIYEKMEKGSNEVFRFSDPLGSVEHMFIKRPVQSNTNGLWYDLTTPYGYGGPVVNCQPGNEGELISRFINSFSAYCASEHIVSEFIRFHPIFQNQRGFEPYYDVRFSRKTVGTNLADSPDPVQREFSKSCRKDIRRALRSGVTFQVTAEPDDVDDFKNIYYQTMERNSAGEYYYFEDNYFSDCLRYFKANIVVVKALFEGKTIAMGFYFKYKNIIHMHLSGTLNDYLHLSPAYVLKQAITEWGKAQGYQLIHHGGGKSEAPDDSLYLFKKKFGANTEFEFYVGRKIWNQEIYNQLCESKGVDPESPFFPAYRKV